MEPVEELERQVAFLQDMVRGLTDRVAKQSDQLSQNAERNRMNPSEYQKLAIRTECNQSVSAWRMANKPMPSSYHPNSHESLFPIRVNHVLLGLMDEVGELTGAFKKHIYYGKPYDTSNVAEELGDIIWVVAQACEVFGLDMSEVMAANLRKLKARYPDRYTDELAQNRDAEAERAAMCGPGENIIEQDV